MSIWEALTLSAVLLSLAALPSASVALVVAKSVSCGRLSGALAVAGIVTGDLIFVVMALSGMLVLAEQLGAIFAIVKYGGGIYLIYLGLTLFRSRPAFSVHANEPTKAAPVSDFLAGLLLTLGDIKALFFYASLFPALIELGRVSVSDALLVITITALTVAGGKLGYVIFASSLAERASSKLASVSQKLGGALMIACGCVLIAKA